MYGVFTIHVCDARLTYPHDYKNVCLSGPYLLNPPEHGRLGLIYEQIKNHIHRQVSSFPSLRR